jgi:hypothetical protein
LTEAVFGLLEAQLRTGFVALEGEIVAGIVVVNPTETDAVAGREIPVTY